ncbi:hypothetical protein LINGRAHAP2_LOCUS24215 [Linum grandiflorum]
MHRPCEIMERQLRALTISEAADLVDEVQGLEQSEPVTADLSLCVVDEFITERTFCLDVVKDRLPEILRSK